MVSWINLAPLIPAGVISSVIALHLLRQRSTRERSPVEKEKILRPPGHTLTMQIESLQENLMTCLCAACFLVAFFPILWRHSDTTVATFFLIPISAVATALVWRWALRIRNLGAGLRGEQVIAEKLTALTAEGFRVFHDLRADCCGNIDHVVVGEAGAFAIETKYRRKRSTRSRQPEHEVILERNQLRFPNWLDTKSLPQAKRNAAWLSTFLTKATGEPVAVEPVLALPGWFVRRAEQNGVAVLSGNELKGFFQNRSSRIAVEQVRRIVHQLDQICRDVEV